MPRSRSGSLLAEYGVALALGVVAVAASRLTVRPFGGAYFYLPLVAVFVAALRGGLLPGLLVVGVCGLGFDYFFLGVPYTFGVSTSEEAHRVAGFVLFGVAGSLIAGRFRAARARAELARREAEAASEEARRIGAQQERLLAVVSHDLRNPLGALRVGLALVSKLGPLGERQRKVVERMRGAADRMEGLVSGVLDLARTRQGAPLAVSRAPARLGAICARVIGELQTAYPEAEIALAVDGDDAGDLDPDRVAQLVSNLVGNAIVHGARDAPVQVRVSGVEGALRLEVENGGDPIPGELLPRLFEPFWRGRSDGHGLGLGLFIVREIARAHGGRIAVRSAVGSTVFEVWLPRRAALDVAGEPPAA
ncbi:sensor histidine kinase [Anaeromyxobacter oryzisoli]|uniref:sensor histidine kinase n=1 Tax=Anaeromyxobacter oryzisoli TaxID=2925408 RepID=UPI001F596FAA|nr:HAMP domain-containing sensor histidine kinase [Anaeromyxobacter sp. SG63]